MFLTLEDPNAKLKGSRDPLGSQPIWAKFGRHVVSNLTMQTTSTRGFTIVLLGRYFGARLIEEAFFWLPEVTTDNVFELAHLHAFFRIEGIKVIQTDLHAAHVPFVFSCVFVLPLNIRRDGVVFTDSLKRSSACA